PTKKQDGDTRQLAAGVLANTSKKRGFARILPFLGPAFIASVAYMDPGNFATNIQAGAQFGYTLVWVVLASNLMAMLVQSLSAKLGIASGHNLAELCRDHYSKPVVYSMWIAMELVAIATDLAEFLGAALGFNLLFGIPLWIAGLLTAFATFIILGLQRYGFRPLEAVITALVAVVAICYFVETILDRPAWGQVLFHTVVPQFSGAESILLASGVLGATVMPHVIFLHSSLTQGRVLTQNEAQMRRLFRFELLDVVIAMGLAGLINMAMMIMAASTFFAKGLTHIATIQDSYLTLEPLLGKAASWVFAISLLASGLSSSAVGTLSGQVIMQGFIHKHIPVWTRRLLTVVPPLVVIIIGLDPTRTLVVSQVILSFGLPIALVPLMWFTRRREVMGVLVNKKVITWLGLVVTGLIIALNLYLLVQIFRGG
ncbi:MAG: Nramp family divalent metal transporter, partial [Anaerolineae bacterium]